ncbi:MAG TPA: hypothetical protein VKO45_02875, partial [Methanomicrobiales archaeon]|nr:hypothetical protein [Methanomicrobiales archaeon]
MKKTLYFLLGIALIGTLLVAGCAQQQAVPPQQTPAPTTVPLTTVQTTIQTPAAPAGYTVKLGDTSLGKVLTGADGMTLYFFITDLAGEGVSTCYGSCASFWPVFYASTISVEPPLRASDFSSITRTDGTMQTTYKGRPLYSFANDKRPGDVKGENVLKTWYVAKTDYTVMIASRPETGAFLTDSTGRALYIWLKDTTLGDSACRGTCAATWPPFSASTLVVPSALSLTDFSTFTRSDGMRQTAFMGRPLYYYSLDKDAGDLYGQGI